jgi:calcineurin-like phosphoesterase family protein
MRWWTSDQHFGHTNICAYSGRPYNSVKDMDADIIARFNSVVSSDDEVYILGDIAMGEIVSSLKLITKLNGIKVLVPGNHDRCFRGNKSENRNFKTDWTNRYEDVGLSVVDGPIEIEMGGIEVIADHFPYRGDSREEERYLEFRPPDLGKWLLHGHVHEKWRQWDNMINVGVDAWGGYPIGDADLLNLISQGRRNLDRLDWL